MEREGVPGGGGGCNAKSIVSHGVEPGVRDG